MTKKTTDHYESAKTNLRTLEGTQPTDVTQAGAAYAQAHATLALVDAVHELREELYNAISLLTQKVEDRSGD